MISGSKIKRDIFFDLEKQDEYFRNCSSLIDHEYYDYPRIEYNDEGEIYEWHKNKFFDIIVGSFYSTLPIDSTITYNKIIKKYFLNYFTIEKYTDELTSLLNYLTKNISSILNNPDKSGILKILVSEILQVCDIQFRIVDFDKNNEINAYSFISKRALSQYKKTLELLHRQNAIFTRTEIEEDFYKRNPGVSWHKKPLAFFNNFVFQNGYDRVSQERWYYQDLNYLEGDENVVLSHLFKSEYFKSRDLIEKNLEVITPDNEKQRYLETLLLELKILNDSHNPLKWFKNDKTPYKNLLNWLATSYPYINISEENENFDQYHHLWENEDFLNKLEKFSFTNKKEKKQLLFPPQPNLRDNIKIFLQGQFSKLKTEINFTCSKAALYYLLAKFDLEEKGSKIIDKLKEKPHDNINLNYESLYFTHAAFIKAISEITNNKEQLPGNFRLLIDNLFAKA
ncbi:hypothetical protein [Segetibacter koreensis]|uniref:hypothetical protein n=1 Tax=Segetibacter koreensis TaxID=398037 RepID=UPI0003656F66|nr:hypothetical protein [Segetibacter koreensis]